MAGEDPRRWMWGQALEMLARADRLHRQLFEPAAPGALLPSWEPPVDVLETERDVFVIAALPGVGERSLTLAIEGAVLLIRGQRTLPEELRTAAIHRMELPQGCFERRVPLPPRRYDQVRHHVRDGCLVISLRKLA
ncbi:Hsp20/alpha crystallin family protein [Phenylobacterium montanum]|uniref:Hsp20/alpha crystallin family protein n=1 Tax=Phenylobacterium montanum TaxID=2823693 RepID=A0A975FYY6_9CAUL|nr:Hsp20/alpha crystallin family protein [Caulobacter sp. S6]QUD86891.1 Hsp20/alpha crystallin family protein [Caulobacter sp. S6]